MVRDFDAFQNGPHEKRAVQFRPVCFLKRISLAELGPAVAIHLRGCVSSRSKRHPFEWPPPDSRSNSSMLCSGSGRRSNRGFGSEPRTKRLSFLARAAALLGTLVKGLCLGILGSIGLSYANLNPQPAPFYVSVGQFVAAALCDSMAWMIASANSEVPAVPPTSRVSLLRSR